jgi:phosphoribosylglycinamide formyltransferase-1
MQQIAIFASGAGSNAREIIRHFLNHPTISISLIVCNKPGAGVLKIADNEKIPALMLEKDNFFRGNSYVETLKEFGIDFIVPDALIKAYPGKIVNIHPALLPKYGGKGMYGAHVHESVIAAGEKESGITIHYVDEYYDHGQPIFQSTVAIEPTDTPESLAEKIHQLEHKFYPVIIEEILNKPNKG